MESGGHLMGYISTLVWDVIKGFVNDEETDGFKYQKEIQLFINSTYVTEYKNHWVSIQHDSLKKIQFK